MPRTFSTAVQGELAKRFGSEPLVLVGIEWSDGNEVLYADRKLNGEEYPYPLLIQVGGFDTTTLVTGGGDSSSVAITLNDIDGHLKSIIDAHDIHLNKVRIYLGFQGLPHTEKALMFEGQINSPTVWDETYRTLSLTSLNTIESQEAGFMMDDGDFPFVPPAQRNQAWPLVFGQVCNMEAVHVTTLRKGILAEGQGVKDPTLDERLCQAYKLKCPNHWVTESAAGAGSSSVPLEVVADPSSSEGSESYTVSIGTNTRNVFAGKDDKQCNNRRFLEICRILREKQQQEQHVKSEITIRGGDDFPQNELITIRIGDVKFDGVMVGEEFSISQVYHPDLDTIDNPPCKDINDAKIGLRARPGSLPGDTVSCDAGPDTIDEDLVNGSGESWRYFTEFEKSRFIWLPPGSEVTLDNESQQIYIASLLPGVVDQVSAYKRFEDTSLLTAVPTELYEVHTVDYGAYQVVEIRLDRPLSSIEDENWDDTLYVSFTSSVGPNPADVIDWLLATYTDLTLDPTSYAAVSASLQNYPANFWVKSRPDVLKLIQDIAYQFRCSAIIRNGSLFLTYLSTEPTSIRTLTESDILANTFRVSHTETEDLITKHSISWREGEAGIYEEDETEFSFNLKLNIPRYGVREESYDYYTQNTFSTIEKSATFWLIRRANTWKQIEFETPIRHLDLDVFDCVTVNIGQFPTTKCVITEAQYNADTNTVRFKCWTPILAGASESYLWAWPALQDAEAVFEGDFGENPNATVIPPEGHPLRAGYDPEASRLATAGDRHPSDLDDSFPTLLCKVATGAEILPSQEPTFDPLAEESFADKLDAIESRGLNANVGNDGEGEDQEESSGCGGNTGNFCAYEVRIDYIIPETVTTATSANGTCKDAGPCAEGGPGRPCTGQIKTKCHQFPTRHGAESFITRMRQESDQLWDNCLYVSGREDVFVKSHPGITVIEPPPPPPCKSQFDVDCGGIPLNCGESTQGFADPSLENQQANKPAESE